MIANLSPSLMVPLSTFPWTVRSLSFILSKIGILGEIDFDIEEVGKPIKFNWGKCPLATASFGHGITTTLLQLAKAYSIIVNGGYTIQPRLIKKEINSKYKKLAL